MQIPEKIKIGGLIYDIEMTKYIGAGENCDGEIDFSELKIKIRPTARRNTERTFLHEVVHALLSNLGYTEHDEKHTDEFAGVCMR
jgi:hypothetical protein